MKLAVMIWEEQTVHCFHSSLIRNVTRAQGVWTDDKIYGMLGFLRMAT